MPPFAPNPQLAQALMKQIGAQQPNYSGLIGLLARTKGAGTAPATGAGMGPLTAGPLPTSGMAAYIAQQARARGLDPAAVLAVAKQEGLGGGVGDGGHAFGPFQLNDAGGVLTGRPGNHRQFAESPEGVQWALDRIAQVAKGEKGLAAIKAIVSRFERPANPGREIANAAAAYGR